jgi:hypothetical protein
MMLDHHGLMSTQLNFLRCIVIIAMIKCKN